MCLLVHLEGTTGEDAAARRRHRHAERCAQCGTVLTPANRVAAHVTVAPLGLPCLHRPHLVSACRRCNHTHHKPKWFWVARVRGRPLAEKKSYQKKET